MSNNEEELLKIIYTIINSGETAEVRYNKDDGIKVYAVKKELKHGTVNKKRH